MSSSYLSKQTKLFKSDVTAAAGGVSSAKRAPVVKQLASVPSPAPSNTSVTSKSEKDNKRKREASTPVPANTVYSQPEKTGYGTEAFTQVTYVIDFLKNKDEPKTFHEILQYLSQHNADEGQKKLIAQILRRHQRVTFTPDPNDASWHAGHFSHKPLINVRNKTDLIAYLQKKADAQGVLVKELKDGWPDCEEAINELEAENRILVTRTKKDNHARMVWSNDPSLVHAVDHEFQVMWHQVQLPSVDDTVRSLINAKQKPASEDPSKRAPKATKAKEKKKKAQRKGGKVTNTHMAHLLVDYKDKYHK
ncbi:hypothetical protein HYALB_00007188 [Hymenoscyphus albidus]|uniref:Transcription initiation factor IIE subunit beta n=1 Tax=Hymenoscyphus albidus TaxID=595503 RepID=A0A9N9LY41_9HELO|nr:hypothetical protein HYALB_00007188 [Hymenoscyphus albidus]